MSALTDQQLESFHTDGYLVLPALFNADEVQAMRRAADEMLNLALNSSIALGRKSGRLTWGLQADGSQHVKKIQPVNDLSECLTNVSDDDRLLGPMRSIMGCEPILMEEKLNYKQPLKVHVDGVDIPVLDDRWPIHSDWAYFKSQNYPQDILSSAVSLDESTPENGPLHVWPGTHKHYYEHHSVEIGLEVSPDEIDFNGGVDILAPPGSVMIFHALLVHNSRHNTTSGPRRIMIYSHYPGRVDMGHDIRNGPARAREQEFENRYREMVARGEYKPVEFS
jgi:ectoine hydroxylase